MGKPYSFIKITLLILNTIFLVLGALLIALGAYALDNLKEVSQLINTGLPIGLIVLGIFIFILSFFGCCGAAVENRFMLLIYFFILLGLLICQISIGAVAYSESNDIRGRLETGWNKLDNDTKEWFENEFECCGFDEPSESPQCMTDHPNWEDPCGDKIADFFRRNMLIIFYVGIIFAILEIIGLLFALILYCCIARKHSREKRERLLG